MQTSPSPQVPGAPSVSVLVSSYNYAAYVVDAVNSALAQTVPPAQVIVVDDGSSDGSLELLRRHFGAHPKVTLIRQQNQGQLRAWTTAYARASGEIVAFLDSDDLWQPEYLERVLAVYAARPEVDFVYANMQLFGQVEGPMRRPGPDRDLGLSILLGAYVHRWQGTATSAMSLRRRLADGIFALPEDMAAEWRSRPDDCLVYGGEILGAHKVYLGTPLVRHRQHGANAKNAYRRAPLAAYRHLLRSERMLAFYRQRMGVDAQWLRMAKAEFRTKPAPSWFDLRAYTWLLFRAPMPLGKRVEHWFGMLAHFLRSRRSTP